MKRILGTIGVLSTLAVRISAGACATIEAHTPPITDAGGKAIAGSLNTIETVMLGGVAQTITIRGVDRSKPVFLHLHGGPGIGALLHLFPERELTVAILGSMDDYPADGIIHYAANIMSR